VARRPHRAYGPFIVGEAKFVAKAFVAGTTIADQEYQPKLKLEELTMATIRLVCALALPAGILLGSLGAASAQGSDAAREACTPDAMRLCNEFIPDEARVKACMLSKRSQLSEACRLAMRGRPAERERIGREERHHYHHRHHRDD
jgi:hypothetical protein